MGFMSLYLFVMQEQALYTNNTSQATNKQVFGTRISRKVKVGIYDIVCKVNCFARLLHIIPWRDRYNS